MGWCACVSVWGGCEEKYVVMLFLWEGWVGLGLGVWVMR